MNPSSLPVRPVKPASGYLGGKKNLARTIVPIIDRTPHDTYAEPFVGMGGIFFRRRRRPPAEFINDISGDVVTFFRVLQEHYPYFVDMLRFRVASRGEFERLRALPADRLTDLQRAARFLYLQRLAFGGHVDSRSFGIDLRRSGRFNVTTIEPMLAEIHERLANVSIDQLPFADFIARYDRPHVLFYLDPPYWGHEGDYGADVFARADFEILAARLAAIAGKFMLSINDGPGPRECFGAFNLTPVETRYQAGGMENSRRVGELIVTNFELGSIAG